MVSKRGIKARCLLSSSVTLTVSGAETKSAQVKRRTACNNDHWIFWQYFCVTPDMTGKYQNGGPARIIKVIISEQCVYGCDK